MSVFAAIELDLDWRTTLMTLVLVPVLIFLGFWQLDRAQEKVTLAEQNTQRVATPPTPLAELIDLPSSEAGYRRVSLTGHFVPNATAFLDNQMRDGRYGHDVLSLFMEADSDRVVLLNRGWVPGDSSRRSLPAVDAPEGRQQLLASIYIPPGEPYLLADEKFAQLDWPLLIQTSSSKALRTAIEQELQKPVYPQQLRLLPDQPWGYRRDWPLVNVSPQKHQGYAVQWFTMAAALLILFVFRSSNALTLLRGRTRRAAQPGGS